MFKYLDSHEVSADYVWWADEERELRAVFLSTVRGMTNWFDEAWTESEANASDIFNPDQHDEGLAEELFSSTVGVYPDDYFSFMSASVIKDACSLYEGFLERTADSLLTRYETSLKFLSSDKSWQWSACRDFYAHYVGVTVQPGTIEAVLWIRNKLTHLRGQLRTTGGGQQLRGHLDLLHLEGVPVANEEETLDLRSPYLRKGLSLSPLQSWRILDRLATHIGGVALAAFEFEYGRRTSAHFEALRDRQPLKSGKFNPKTMLEWKN
ncbi:hypothetical protein [Paramicrobacterium agarici]|uniref:hypothetical protein n=1 Tax=Paramicrobacterium agarici TaxID=630514 RepID=UPI0011517DE6|nr:hypothetical protein [Microbacterium agarici]TQO24248.1 hypothetical protein FB385_3128 [Microbacterium agarici]